MREEGGSVVVKPSGRPGVANTEQSSRALRYFDMLADIGVTKHIGSMKATDEVVGLCQIGTGSMVLEVGCGVGLTSCYLARGHGCRVVGVDIFPRMIERSREQALRKRVQHRAKFLVGDAQALPFEDDLFDAVVIESVSVFVPDIPRAFKEYVRVTKPGGYVGMDESTWIEPPSERTDEFMAVLGAQALTMDEWQGLLADAGLENIVARAYRANVREEAKGRLKRYGLGGIFRALFRTVPALVRNPSARTVLRQSMASVPRHIAATIGYGVYVGRKAPEMGFA